ncbi:hypothetical protein CHGG_10661 [Chaetomium globosum CBS 148.51]|uniref:Protein kinase domain-containing protein n=1 Tax=Chaetomium globosum (strain ATCC 6205 / CBS 148.51 / DSM 1962 / NBRC 6347 / NRRL 1970) TaxID=306901 RepID=Q2GMZ3_CHAGB|nr:uncharacterized protein CHGG_10661 [Chaetomium globosum CBS 148.51]EAQ84257.1 hypothetical protein CHGG_10661 [Chaetomium globosum CBS 148.51]
MTATIQNILGTTMSPVREVVIRTESGSELRAVLKIYDRRFGLDLRHVNRHPDPHRGVHEDAFLSFVERGKITGFLEEHDREGKERGTPVRASWYLDEAEDGRAMYEAALWQECADSFECETEAYSRLSDLQGDLIPQMYAHVRITGADETQPPSPSTARYFEIRGVLLEAIGGYKLWDIATAPEAPADPGAWQAIIQNACNAAHEINTRGVYMEDCAARNVVVDARTQKPFIVDLAQCEFRDKLAEMWREMDDNDEDWDPDVEYWQLMQQSNNPAKIGSPMVRQLQLQRGIELQGITYPDYDGIIRDVRRKKGLKS